MRSRLHCAIDDSAQNTDAPLVEWRPEPDSHLLMLTGQLAEPNLKRLMEAMNPQGFTWEIRVMPYQVIAWMACEDVPEKIGSLEGVDCVMIPGRCAGSATDLQKTLGVAVIRGPNCYSELGTFLEEHGFIRDTSDPPRPKVVVKEDRPVVAPFLAQTYETPLINIAELVAAEIGSGSDLGKSIAELPNPHNAIAELVRGRLTMPDAALGWVMTGYPTTFRDAEWLEEMGQVPDAYLAITKKTDMVVEFYRKDPIFLEIDPEKPERSRKEEALVKIEARMQACVSKL